MKIVLMIYGLVILISFITGVFVTIYNNKHKVVVGNDSFVKPNNLNVEENNTIVEIPVIDADPVENNTYYDLPVITSVVNNDDLMDEELI